MRFGHADERVSRRGAANPPIEVDRLPMFRGLRPLKKWRYLGVYGPDVQSVWVSPGSAPAINPSGPVHNRTADTFRDRCAVADRALRRDDGPVRSRRRRLPAGQANRSKSFPGMGSTRSGPVRLRPRHWHRRRHRYRLTRSGRRVRRPSRPRHPLVGAPAAEHRSRVPRSPGISSTACMIHRPSPSEPYGWTDSPEVGPVEFAAICPGSANWSFTPRPNGPAMTG